MRFLCAIRIVCWRVSVFYVAAVSAIPADGVPCGGRVLHGHLLALPPRCLVGWRGCFGRLPTPPLVYFPAPSPQPPSPVGKGEIFCFLMQGASPLAFPRLNPRGTCSPCRCGALWGACPLCRLPPLPLVCFSAPPPSPVGKGGGYKFISPGASPPAPPGLNPWFAAQTEERCFL